MRALFLLFVALLGVAAQAGEGIRAFPIPTIAALGRELYRRDQSAADATDILMDAVPNAGGRPVRGWITELAEHEVRVFFIQEKEAKLSLAYVVTLPEKGKALLEDRE